MLGEVFIVRGRGGAVVGFYCIGLLDIQHKYATARYLYNRLDSYNLQQRKYQQELNIIHNILHNNSFPIKPHKPQTPNPDKPTNTHTTQKWANFTYIGKETTYITNIFKRTDLKITFRTTNTLASLLTHKDRAPDKYSLSGVYKLTCPVIKRMLDKQKDNSPPATKNTRPHRETTAPPPVLHYTL